MFYSNKITVNNFGQLKTGIHGRYYIDTSLQWQLGIYILLYFPPVLFVPPYEAIIISIFPLPRAKMRKCACARMRRAAHCSNGIA